MPTLQELLANNPDQIAKLYGLQQSVQPDALQDPTQDISKDDPQVSVDDVPVEKSPDETQDSGYGDFRGPIAFANRKNDQDIVDKAIADSASQEQPEKDGPSLFDRISDQLKNQVAKGNVGVDEDSDDKDEDDSRDPAAEKSDDSEDDDEDEDDSDDSDDKTPVPPSPDDSKTQPQPSKLDLLQQAINQRNNTLKEAEIGKYVNLAASGIGGVMNRGARPTEIHNEMNQDLINQANNPINDFAMKQQYAQEQIKNDPNSGYSQLMRASLQKMGVNAPPTLTGAAIEKAFPTLAKVYDTQLQVEARRDATKDQLAMRQLQQQDLSERRQEAMDFRNQTHNEQMSHQTDQDFEKFAGKMNSATASSRSLLGRTANSINQADRVNALIQQTQAQPGGASPQQLYELARAQDSLISGGTGTVSGTAHLVPSTALGSLANFQQWLTNSPAGSNPSEFVNRISDTVKRERGVAQRAQQQALNQMAPGFAHLQQKDPDRYKSIMDATVNSPQGIAPQVQSGQFTPDVVAYAQKHNISPEQALAIKLQRTGGQ